MRVLAAEGDDRLGDEVPHRDAAGGDADRAAAAVAELAELTERGIQGGKAAERGLVEGPAGLRRRDAAGLAFDQDQAGLFFQALDVLADRRLGAAQRSGDGAEVPGLVHPDEHAQIIKGRFPKLTLGPRQENPGIDLGQPWLP